MALNKGWVYLNYGTGSQIQVQCEDYDWDIDDKGVKIIQIPSDSRFGYSLAIIKREIRLKNVFFESHADLKQFISDLKSFNSSGAFPFRIQRDSAGNWVSIDGTNDEIDVFYLRLQGIRKYTRGDGNFYIIKTVKLGQAG